MTEPSERLAQFEARLAALKQKMEAGLSERVDELRAALTRLHAGDETARHDIKRLSHRLRGIAGTYGHRRLTELSADLEQRASLSPPPSLSTLVEAVVAEALRIRGSQTTEVAQAVLSERPPPRKRRPSLMELQAQYAEQVGPRPRVLAMDDDPNTLQLLEMTLAKVAGFDAVLVSAATEALQLLEQGPFDLVVSDAMMPDMNGREFCQRARALGGAAAEVPIVILSAANADELGWRSGELGATTWLHKPFRPLELAERLKAIIAEHGAP